MKKKILRTIIPFIPDIRLEGDSIADMLTREIENTAAYYKKDPHSFSAKVEMAPSPLGRSFGHYLSCEVVYHKGLLKNPKKT